jgi:Fe-S cluster biogenesis protein NfuA
MEVMTKAMKEAVKWLREHGGECVVAKTIAGGRIYLAQGETGPFMPVTIKKLVEAGLVEKIPASQMKASRYRLIGGVA